ncbi:MAG: hypothetical protein RL092_796 [Bacteroidota bacterium]|jgi:hypothetical protein
MKKLLLAIGAGLLFCFQVSAQCPTCTPDVTCVSTDGFPTICPATLPNATTGQYYEGVLTFYLPANVTDPASGVDATLLQITITSVDGLPFGMSFTINDPDATYYPSQGENYGCATICGTPVLPGTYDVVISVAAIAEAFGFQVTQNQSFVYPIIVEQGPGGTSTFSYDQSAGCGDLTVDYVATIGGQPGQLTTYNWNFGNGQTSTEADPAAVYYAASGDYTASLTTVISNYVITSVNLSGVNGNWDGDADDLFSTADPYFTINNAAGSVVYTSGTVDNQTSASYGGVNFTLSNPPYTITFWDADDITQDDNLGTSNINIAVGSVSFNSGNGTSGTMNISLSEVTNVTSNTTINVFPQPGADISISNDVISAVNDSMPTYFWFHDGIIIPAESSSSLTMTESGYYTVELINEYGCSATSDPYLYCAPVVPSYDAVADELSVPDTYDSYQWFYNGILLQGATTYYLINPQNGVYAIQVTNSYGCELMSNTFTVNVGINEITSNDLNVSVYPNPFEHTLNVQWNNTHETAMLTIRDVAGRIVKSEPVTGGNAVISTIELTAGNYIVELQSADTIVRKHVIKQ